MKRVALALLVTLAGCHAPLTELVVVTDTDLQVPDELDTVRFEVDATAIGSSAIEIRETSIVGAGAPSLPLVLVLLHDGGDAALGPIRVRAIGRRGGSERVRHEARTSFIRERSTVLRLDLFARCVDQSCPDGETCGPSGECRDARIDPSSLPAWSPHRDAGRHDDDGGTGPAVEEDAGSRACEDTGCSSGCECSGGCECTLSCREGDTCESGVCRGAGTRCAVQAQRASNFAHRCEDGATCDIDARDVSNVRDVVCTGGADCSVRCEGSSNCFVRCESGARCALRCDEDSSSCEITSCDGDLRECDDDYWVCNRGC